MILKLDTVGTIKSGEYINQQVRVIDDSDESRLYITIIGKDLSSDEEGVTLSKVFEAKEELQEYFDQSNWLIEWQ